MTQTDRCPDCGDERRDGVCPRCLIRLGLDGPSRPGGTTTPAGVMETLAASIGAVPRVLLRDTDPGEEPSPVLRPTAERDTTLRYRIDGEIARGGMGAVLKGRDPDLNRDVALKVLRDDFRDDLGMVRRFVEEAQIGGQLQHPGVVPIYELGTLADRRPFFAMRLVKGRTLAELLDDCNGPSDDRPRFLSIFEDIAQTMAYAHARGVIHRDLKPANVMVGAFGEVQVMDWGLAKVLPRDGTVDDENGQADRSDTAIATASSDSDAPGLTRPGSAMGTPAYMAPEQARGEAVDERADVFALGSILCEVLTGKPAFLGRSGAEILRRASLGDVAHALGRLDASAADPELIAIARDCLDVEPEVRPRHAGEVARRITGYLSGVQDRLRRAELARAAEKARAKEAIARAKAERRARLFQAGLAAALLIMVTAGVSAFFYLSNEEFRKRTAYAQVIGEVDMLLTKALRDASDPGPWREAMAAVERVEAQGPSDQIAALRRAIDSGLAQAERDARLRQELVEIRAHQMDAGASGTEAAYAAAFRDAELDLDRRGPILFARALGKRSGDVVVELSAFLDDWSASRREAGHPVDAWRRPLEAARRADPDPYRNRLRTILMASDRPGQAEALKAMADAPEASELPAPTAILLGKALKDAGRLDAAAALLRRAAVRFPEDVWVNYTLAEALERMQPSVREEAVRYYTAARALRPETAHALAHLLERLGRSSEAESIFRDLVRRRPEETRHLGCLGDCLKDLGRADEATPLFDRVVAAARARLRQNPDDAQSLYNLGSALRTQGKQDEAIAAYCEAIRIQPDFAEAHNNLGKTLLAGGNRDEAMVALRAAIRLKPDFAQAHSNLGSALLGQGKQDEAIASFREAIRIQPDFAWAYDNLGNALLAQGNRDEAAAAYREAIRLRPDDADAHYNLGITLLGQGNQDEAIESYREAIRLRPDYAEAHCSLAHALRTQGNYDEALAMLRRGHELGSRRPDWRYPSARWVAEAERMSALAMRLPAVLHGDDRPKDAAECLTFARICYDTRRYAAAARFWDEAFAADPRVAEDLVVGDRYGAACAAILAAAGKDEHEPKLDEPAKARWRKQAAAWLRVDLARRSEQARSGPPAARDDLAGRLRRWKADPELAAIRDADAIKALPDDEQAACRALWNDVDTLFARVTGGKP